MSAVHDTLLDWGANGTAVGYTPGLHLNAKINLASGCSSKRACAGYASWGLRNVAPPSASNPPLAPRNASFEARGHIDRSTATCCNTHPGAEVATAQFPHNMKPTNARPLLLGSSPQPNLVLISLTSFTLKMLTTSLERNK